MNKSNWSFAGVGWLAFAGLILVGCGGTPISYIRQDPQLALRSTDFKTIAVVPTSADLYLGRGGEGGRLDEHSVRIAADLDRLLAEQFSDRGFDVRVVESSKVYADKVEHLMSKIKEGMYGIGGVGPATSEQINFSLGSDVQPIADAASADVLVFTDFSGWKRSGGSVVGEYMFKIIFFAPADSTAAANMFVALVDAKSGDLLWGNKVTDRSLAMNPPDYGEGRLSDMVTEAFSELTLAREQ